VSENPFALENSEEAHTVSIQSNPFPSGQQSVSSMSSTTNTSFAFNKIIKDFKKALGERKTPKNLSILNRIMIVIMIVSISLSSVDFASLNTKVDNINTECEHNLKSENRILKLVQLSSNVRSFVNIANGLEFEKYESEELSKIDRFSYLKYLIAR